MTGRTWFALLTFFLAVGRVPAADAPRAQWIAVTAPDFREAVEPLGRHRAAQGMRVTLVTTTDVLGPEDVRSGKADRLRDRVTKLCRDFDGTSYVLLVGAVEAEAGAAVPPLPGGAGRMKNRPSDNGYGSPGEDLLPAVAVGRLPARSADEARVMVRKTLDYERDDRPGEWKRRLTVLAGAPEFNPVIDAVVERMAVAQLARIDPAWHGKALYHNSQSRFTLPDDQCHERARRYVEEGQALTLYLGHSNATGFYANRERFLSGDDWAKLTIARGPGVFATFGCYGCQLAGKPCEGYGIAAIRNAGGPAAVLGSHGECFAAMVKLASEAFTDSLLGPKPPERLGGAWLRLKEGLAKGKIDALTYRLLDAADGDPSLPQAVQRREHQEMFVLLGDPALRLPSVPRDVTLGVTGDVTPRGRLTLSGEAPPRLEGGRVRLVVERPRDSDPAESVALPPAPGAARDKAVVERHERANEFSLFTRELTVKGGRFEASVELPEKLPWRKLVARAYAATERAEGLGVLTLEVKRAP